MNKRSHQICLKTADGSLYPLFSDFSEKEINFTIVTAHENQKKVQLDFSLKVLSDEEKVVPLAHLELEDLPVSMDGQTTLYLKAEIDMVENLFISVEEPESGISDSVEIILSEYNQIIMPEEESSDLPVTPPRRSFLTYVLISVFVLIAGGMSLLAALFLGNKLSSPPPPPLQTSLYRSVELSPQKIL